MSEAQMFCMLLPSEADHARVKAFNARSEDWKIEYLAFKWVASNKAGETIEFNTTGFAMTKFMDGVK